jgi:mono/diheme cytochrome c family protein
MAEKDARKTSALGMATGALALAVLIGSIGLVVVYSGAYNVAATEEHTSLVRWAFDTTFRNSVERRAPEPEAPVEVTPEALAAGASAYKSMCEHCHGGPGAERASWASGMRPRPPHLAEAAKHWELREVFWIAKHGVKMTGMPAFGPSHDDRTLWGIAAFVKQLPAMAPEQYAALGDAPEHHSSAGGASGHDTSGHAR